jgi:photosystem II stability/assembly factor-like uncharacterized protein
VDRGATWEVWNFGLFDLSILSIVVSPGFASDRTVYVGTESGVFTSKNGGRAWRETNFPAECAPVLCLAASPALAEEGTLFAGTEAAGLLRSEDRGQTWQHVAGLDIAESVHAILLSAQKPDVLVVCYESLWVSHDKGASWQLQPSSGAGFTTAIAPAGFETGSPVLLGVADGSVVRM